MADLFLFEKRFCSEFCFFGRTQFASGFGRAARLEVVAKIGLFFINDAIGDRFGALIITGRIVMDAVLAATRVAPTVRAAFRSAKVVIHVQLFIAVVANGGHFNAP